MTPILYHRSETAFTSNGIGRLSDCVSCTVTEERNGIYECQFTYPMDGEHYADIVEGNYIAVIHDDNKDIQPFEIYARSAPLEGIVTFYAHHISYQLGNIILAPFTATSCAQAFAQFPLKAYNTCPFTFWTDKSTTGTFTVNVPVSIKEILGGTAGSILDVYGKAEYEWDKYTVKLYLNRGRRTDVEIRYGKNLSALTQDKDISQSYTAVAPYWYNAESDTRVVLPEGIILAEDAVWQLEPVTDENYQAITNEIGVPIELYTADIKPVPMDLTEEWEEAPTVDELREMALKKMKSNQSWLPDENIKVSFVQLWQTDEYANVAPLQRVGLCDRVNIVHERLGIRATGVEVIKVVYNVLLERYDSMELGQPHTSFAEAVRASTEEAILKVTPTRTAMEQAIDAATQLITGGLGGHVVMATNGDGQPNEILIMDTDNIATAQNVLRINQAGIGFSSTGYNGPFLSAWTLDGKFYADWITAGTLDGNLIRAGIITDKAGKVWWNLDTGEFSIKREEGETGEVTPDDLAATLSEAKQYTDSELTTSLANYLTQGQTVELLSSSITSNNQSQESHYTSIFAGKDSTLSTVKHLYYRSSSPYEPFGGEWVENVEWQQGTFIWQKDQYINAAGVVTSETAPVCITGNTGDAGAPGANARYLYITSSGSTMTPREETATATLTACVGEGEETDIDPSGYELNYAWFKSTDGKPDVFYGRTKTVTVTINSAFCDESASMRFAIVEAEFFNLTNENDVVLTDEFMNALEVS